MKPTLEQIQATRATYLFGLEHDTTSTMLDIEIINYALELAEQVALGEAIMLTPPKGFNKAYAEAMTSMLTTGVGAIETRFVPNTEWQQPREANKDDRH